MKTLNLVDPKKSDIEYELIKFPDGQQSIKIKGYDARNVEYGEGLVYSGVTIMSRLNNFKDLEIIICAQKALYNLGFDTSLYVPYFLGSRSDRRFEPGTPSYLREVICPIINNLEFDEVTVMDPHSYTLEACLNNFVSAPMGDFYSWVAEQLPHDCIVVSPDAGAEKRTLSAAKLMGLESIIQCSKVRDKDGSITKTVVPVKLCDFERDIVIIDDICDGGATFVNIVKEIKKQLADVKAPHGNIFLVVTHGIFSKGFIELSKYFDGVYCTNSYQDLPKEIIVQKLTPSTKEITYNKVKQFNVF